MPGNPTTSRWRLAAVALAILLLAAGCSDSGKAEVGSRPDLSGLSVWDASAEREVALTDALASDGPVLVWFWAPHCPACAAEAPHVVEFAEDQGDRVTVVGLGTQDDAAMAGEFIDRHDIPFTMLWDETFESWQAFGITRQPAVVLLSAAGEVLGTWSGSLPTDEVEALVA